MRLEGKPITRAAAAALDLNISLAGRRRDLATLELSNELRGAADTRLLSWYSDD